VLIHRIWTALVFAPALLYAMWKGGLWLQIACALVCGLMLWEYLRLAFGAGNQRFTKGVAYALGAVVCAALFGWVPTQWLLLVVPLGTIALFIAMVLRPEPVPETVHRAGAVALGVLYAVCLFPFISLLREVPEIGFGLSLAAVFCTWAADTGAYFAGRAFGRHKLYPKISPGKTVEGAIGGLASAVGGAFLIRLLFDTPIETPHLIGLGLVAGLFGIIGDLSESLLKRSVGAKDSSGLIPGHGGVLDRFDGVMFAAPAVFAYAVLAM
jgi:phosphatidate cytidylyltransferase